MVVGVVERRNRKLRGSLKEKIRCVSLIPQAVKHVTDAGAFEVNALDAPDVKCVNAVAIDISSISISRIEGQLKRQLKMDDLQDEQIESQDIAQETPAKNVFIPPSINKTRVLSGDSYTHHSQIPSAISQAMSTECVLGVDEAGRGPVLGEIKIPISLAAR